MTAQPAEGTLPQGGAAAEVPRNSGIGETDEARLCQLILEIANPGTRDAALQELGRKREMFPDLAPYLWYSFGTVPAFLQEIVAVYPCLYPPTLNPPQSQRVCNCLALLQCIASHPETKHLCLKAHIPLYLYPFLNSVSNNRALEYLRLTALGVIGALVKEDDVDVLRFLLQSEIVPLCLRIMDVGSELSQTVATFIVQKVLMYDEGLAHLCATAERFHAMSTVLLQMLNSKSDPPSARLLKHLVRCYTRLCDNPRAREALKHCLPDVFWTNAFEQQIKHDPAIGTWIRRLLQLVESDRPVPSSVVEAADSQLQQTTEQAQQQQSATAQGSSRTEESIGQNGAMSPGGGVVSGSRDLAMSQAGVVGSSDLSTAKVPLDQDGGSSSPGDHIAEAAETSPMATAGTDSA